MHYVCMFIWRCCFRLTGWLRFAASLVAGAQPCLRCGCPVYKIPVCNRCRNENLHPVIPLSGRCCKCGRELLTEHELCMECRRSPVLCFVEKAFSLFPYVFWYRELLYEWKTAGDRRLSVVFADELYRLISGTAQLCSNGIVLPIVPVPPRPGKIQMRGWDQVRDLAVILHLRYNIPVLNLLRCVRTVEQKHRSRTERLKGLAGTYVFDSKSLRKPLPSSVILLDDIMTTGATLEACATQLCALGILHIYAVTIASVQ